MASCNVLFGTPDSRESIVIMVYKQSLAVLCSALVGLSNAAALGSAEEYADGTVHARIMGLKMVIIFFQFACLLSC